MKQKSPEPELLKRFGRWLTSRREAEAEVHLYNASRLADWAAEGAGKPLNELSETDIMKFIYDDYIRETDGHGRQVSVLPESIEMFFRYLKVVEGLPENPSVFTVCKNKARYRRRLEMYRTLDPGGPGYEEQRRQWKEELAGWMASVTSDENPSRRSATPGRRIETATVFFAGLNGFLELSCSQPLDLMGERLDAMYHECGETVFTHGGEVARFVGDGVLAHFPVPLTSQAAMAGLDLSRRMNQLFEKWETPDLSLGVGIHTGEVLLGTFGHPCKRGFDVVGNPVALAALMARKSQLLISKAALDACQGKVFVKKRHSVDVRWARQLLHAFELQGGEG